MPDMHPDVRRALEMAGVTRTEARHILAFLRSMPNIVTTYSSPNEVLDVYMGDWTPSRIAAELEKQP